MNYKAKEEYRLLIQPRYQCANKTVKQRILDEFCAVCGYHRKYAIALLKKLVRVKKSFSKAPGPKPRYQDADFLKVLQRIWYETDLSCAKRLKAAIPLWLPKYGQHYGELSEEIQHKLLTISSASIDRALKPLRDRIEIKKRSQTKPGTLLKHKIPYKLDVPWNSSLPGFVEADTVAHCGGNTSGNHAWSLTLTDIRTTWTENRAVWNKGGYGVLMQIKDIEEHLPFSSLGFNCDSGSEFLNQHLIGYLQGKKKPNLLFARSRPNKKNDNAHVEQKNWTHVRHLFGYGRLGKFGVDELMNDLYKNEWRLYQNFFMPSMKLIEKTRIGSRYRKKYDFPQTPYQRVLQEPSILQEQKEKLTMIYQSLDPFSLRKSTRIKLNQILKYSGLK
ncbi:MAG TPA: integrase [Gammaproteobacteria bacterium]|nr:integrase [Gammaproteobacteria bacterium]